MEHFLAFNLCLLVLSSISSIGGFLIGYEMAVDRFLQERQEDKEALLGGLKEAEGPEGAPPWSREVRGTCTGTCRRKS